MTQPWTGVLLVLQPWANQATVEGVTAQQTLVASCGMVLAAMTAAIGVIAVKKMSRGVHYTIMMWISGASMLGETYCFQQVKIIRVKISTKL